MVKKHWELTEKIIACFFRVYNSLGYGFLEKVYETTLAKELELAGLKVERQRPITVFYHGEIIGEYFADLLINDSVIVEIKAVRAMLEEHEAQLLNYLKATRYEVGLLLNFGQEAKFKRKAFDNEGKGNLRWTSPNQSPRFP